MRKSKSELDLNHLRLQIQLFGKGNIHIRIKDEQ